MFDLRLTGAYINSPAEEMLFPDKNNHVLVLGDPYNELEDPTGNVSELANIVLGVIASPKPVLVKT